MEVGTAYTLAKAVVTKNEGYVSADQDSVFRFRSRILVLECPRALLARAGCVEPFTFTTCYN